MKITTLISGSKGNCALIRANGANILIDCGSSYTRIKSYLNKTGLAINDIDGVLVTHSHGDHVSALPLMSQKNPLIRFFVHRDGAEEFFEKTSVRPTVFDGKMELNGLEIDTYRCHHDTSCCNGYSVSDGRNKICYVTDTGCVDRELMDFLRGAKDIVIESNHDYHMLVFGKYAPSLKKRIAGTNGHLSNEQTAYLLERTDLAWTERIILAHLSENNNLPEAAYECAKQVLEKNGAGRIKLSVARQWEATEW